MTNSAFNYESQAFAEKAAAPGFWNYAVSAAQGINRYFRIRQTRRRLHDLPDNILKDIGLSRGDIDRVAAHERHSRHDVAA